MFQLLLLYCAALSLVGRTKYKRMKNLESSSSNGGSKQTVMQRKKKHTVSLSLFFPDG